ncbi:MAG: LiaF transmembrane domain-containing protein [Acidimicrobiia bacterium]
MNWGRLFFGLLIVAVGTVLLLDNAGVLDAGEIFGTWWPAVLVLAGILTFAANPRHWPVALIITGIGVAFLLSNLDIVDIGSIVIPAAIILVGLLVIFGRGLGSPTEAGDRVNSFNVFSGSEIASHSKQFQGGSISAVFGGAEVDLRDTVPAPDAALDVFAAFGGVEVTVPEGWNVVTRGLPLFGGIDNATAKEAVPADAPTLAVNATVLFGGLEIKH